MNSSVSMPLHNHENNLRKNSYLKSFMIKLYDVGRILCTPIIKHDSLLFFLIVRIIRILCNCSLLYVFET